MTRSRTDVPGRRPGIAMLISAALLAMLAAAGCGKAKPATAPVAGTVLHDGKPLADAAVLFEPLAGGVPARGSTDSDGRFTLSTFDRNDGALVGRHRVAISKVTTANVAVDEFGLEAAPPPAGLEQKSLLRRRYADPATSGLEAAVESGGTSVEFSLRSGD
jgi:hypothetical protein